MGRTHCTRQSGEWVCVYTNLISALETLLFVCTVGELDLPPIEMILLYLQCGHQYLFYFKGAKFNCVVKLKCVSCAPNSTNFFKTCT